MVITKSAQIVTEQVEKALFKCSVQYDNYFINGKALKRMWKNWSINAFYAKDKTS